MTTRAAKKAPAGKVKAFSVQSRNDYPDHAYEATGKDFYAKLAIRKQHFPAQEKRFLAEQKSAGAKRKGARRAAIIRAGLVDEVEDVNKDSDANDGNDSVKVFQRKAPSKVLLKTKDLCNGYF